MKKISKIGVVKLLLLINEDLMETIVDIGNCVVISEEVGNCTFKQGLKKEKIISTRYLLTYKCQ